MRGMEVVGVRFTGGSAARLEPMRARAWRLDQATAELIRLGALASSQWLGHAVNHAMLMRPGLSVFGHVYAFIRDGDWDSWKKLTPLQLHELKGFKGLVHLAGVDLSAPRAPVAMGGDSSGVSYAVVAMRASPREVMQLDRYFREACSVDQRDVGGTPYQGWSAGAVDRTPGFSAWVASQPAPVHRVGISGAEARARRKEQRALREVCGLVPRLPDEFIDADRWCLVFQGKWHYEGSINEKEARVMLLALRTLARSRPLHGRWVRNYGDKVSALMSFERGRAVSHALRVPCHRAAAYQAGAAQRWPLRYVESERNGADHASRVVNRGGALATQSRAEARAVHSLFGLERERAHSTCSARDSSSSKPARIRAPADAVAVKARAFVEAIAGSARLSAAISPAKDCCAARRSS